MRNKASVRSLFLACLLFSVGLLTSALGQTTPPQSDADHLDFYSDPDAWQIYSILLKAEKHSRFVIRAETDAYPGLSGKDMGIKGDQQFKRLWGSAIEDLAKQN